MFTSWLKTRQEELLAISMAFEQEEAEPLPDGVLYPLLETVLAGICQALDEGGDRTLGAIKSAQRALDAQLELPAFIHSLDVLRRAAQYLVGQDTHGIAEQLAWMGTLNDFLFLNCQVAATMLGSGSQSRLAEERHLMRTLLDSLPDFIFIKDPASRFVLINRSMARFMGADDTEDIVGKTDFELFPHEMAARFRADEVAVMESGQAKVGYEEEALDRQERIHWMQTTKLPLRNTAGNVVGVIGVVRDITDLKQARDRELEQQRIIKAQQETLLELSTPIIPVMDRIIVMPLVGGIDTRRARDIMRTLLDGISQYRARIAILDITGVPVVDSGVADHLNRTIQAARLKGAQTIITGISDAVAETIVDLGIDWSGVETLRDLQTGLLTALERMGFRLLADSPGGAEN